MLTAIISIFEEVNIGLLKIKQIYLGGIERERKQSFSPTACLKCSKFFFHEKIIPKYYWLLAENGSNRKLLSQDQLASLASHPINISIQKHRTLKKIII